MISHTCDGYHMFMIMRFDGSESAERQAKNWGLEDVRNGAHRHERETRCGKIRHQRFFTTEVTCPRRRPYDQVDCRSEAQPNGIPRPFVAPLLIPRFCGYLV